MGEDRSRQPMIGAAVHDPQRPIATVKYCIAKGLLDHPVGQRQKVRRHVEPKRLGGLEIEYQIERRWLHDRRIGRLGAFQYLVDQYGADREELLVVGPI